MENEWVEIKKASELLNVSERTIQRRIKNNLIQSKMVRGRRYVVVNDEVKKITSPLRSQIITIPEGYELIKKETMESIRFQLMKK